MGNCLNSSNDDTSLLAQAEDDVNDGTEISESQMEYLEEVGASIILGTGRTSSEAEASSEDEQIKMAKRFGLIRHLPCGIFDGSTKTRECVICMIDFSVGDRVRYLPCMHTYHTDCIDDWLVRSFTCPSCLEPVDAALLSTYETT